MQGVLLKDSKLYFKCPIRPLVHEAITLKTGDIASFLSTEKQAQKQRQNEKKKKFVPN